MPINKIDKCKSDLKNSEASLHSLIIQLTKYLAEKPANRREQVTQSVAIAHFSKKIKDLEGIVCELNSDLEQAIAESVPKAQRKPKRTIEELDKQRKNDRQESIKRYREDMTSRRRGPQM